MTKIKNYISDMFAEYGKILEMNDRIVRFK